MSAPAVVTSVNCSLRLLSLRRDAAAPPSPAAEPATHFVNLGENFDEQILSH